MGDRKVKVRVLFFGELSDAITKDAQELEAPEGATVGDLMGLVRDRWAHEKSLFDRCMVAVNQEFASPDQPVEEADEVAILPPVSGG